MGSAAEEMVLHTRQMEEGCAPKTDRLRQDAHPDPAFDGALGDLEPLREIGLAGEIGEEVLAARGIGLPLHRILYRHRVCGWPTWSA